MAIDYFSTEQSEFPSFEIPGLPCLPHKHVRMGCTFLQNLGVVKGFDDVTNAGPPPAPF